MRRRADADVSGANKEIKRRGAPEYPDAPPLAVLVSQLLSLSNPYAVYIYIDPIHIDPLVIE